MPKSPAKNSLPGTPGTFPPLIAPLSAELLLRANDSDAAPAFLAEALPLVLEATGAEFATIAAVESGRWNALAEAGQPRPLPLALMAETLDRELPLVDGDWFAAPLAPHAASGAVLLVAMPRDRMPAETILAWSPLAAALGSALLAVSGARPRSAAASSGLEAILEIASGWSQTNEMEPLLIKMAEAATKLLKADRASIFLWDRPNHLLVGRPALGVKGGELRIPDDSGIVGQVVASGEPRRTSSAGNARRSTARSTASSATRRGRCCACRCAAAAASCSAPSR